MTTETATPGRTDSRTAVSAARLRVPGALAIAGGAAVLATVALLVAASATTGSAAVLGVLVAAGIVLVVFGLGTAAVSVVARILPSAALMIAMVTYLLQVVLMAVILTVLQRSGLLGDEIDRAWLGGAVIVLAFVWLIAQTIATATARIPVYDLPSGEPTATPGEPSAHAPSAPVTGGAR